MASVEKISVSMTPQQADLLREAVASGGEVIREALRDWSAKWAQRRGDIGHLKSLWQEGKASGSASDMDLDGMLAEAREELL
ncbi:type II toxin-antitoxin system ParD family antitoxin [Pannonibacter indicus]|uniref:Transcriptional regulator, contains Arc/MetJ-type RHH (Ribbon-helix-helix) DNA-binding domain n=1 Tax=Pannonibacter indicus TaxID=466044 RepID=A0A0K6I5D7_9HYPH|nr:type II toxin-antitoxin system ParD family antitoxin [Pannonibacter indicus]CUA98301.1 Transcriptional regulator, contains Arc/MetJ-type RHH (ribbon-helix-helix) DNA-binding domain [Pannonibacter indicus]